MDTMLRKENWDANEGWYIATPNPAKEDADFADAHLHYKRIAWYDRRIKLWTTYFVEPRGAQGNLYQVDDIPAEYYQNRDYFPY